MSKKNILLRKEICTDVYNNWKKLLNNHKYATFNYRIIGIELNHVFDIILPVTKQHGLHDINGYLYRLRIYPIDISEGNIRFRGYINEEGTKLYVYTKNTFKRGKYIANKHYVYRLYSIDVSFINAFKNSSYYHINVIQEHCGYDYYYTMLPKFNNSYQLLKEQYELDFELNSTIEHTKKKKRSIIDSIFNVFK